MNTEKACCNCRCHEVQVPVTLRDTFFQDPVFSKSWDEFDQVRKDMIAESRQAWQKFDEEMKRLESKSFSRSLNFDSESAKKEEIKEEPLKTLEKSSLLDSEKSWFTPVKLVRFPSLFGDETKFERSSLFKEENLIKVKDDDKTFEITMDTSQYKPDELKINVIQNNLSIEGKHTEKSEDGSSFVSKQFVRKYTLPNGCKGDLVNSNLSADGVLVVSAPKAGLQITDSGRNVPILRA